MRLTILLWLCLTSVKADAKNFLFFLGGSGDPPGETTIFDENLPAIGVFKNKGDWEATVLFDGGRVQSKLAAEKAFGIDVKTFTPEEYWAAIEKFRQMVADKKIGKDDQFLIIVEAHGSNRRESNSHFVEAEAGSTLSLGLLNPLLQELEAAGVRNGIIDNSCFGGASEDFATDNTCVLSLTSNDAPAVNLSAGRLFQEMSESKTLEEAFRNARLADDFGEYPEISTFQGQMLTQFFRPLERRNQFGTRQEATIDLMDSYFKITTCELYKEQGTAISDLLQKVESIFHSPELQEVLQQQRSDRFSEIKKLPRSPLMLRKYLPLKEGTEFEVDQQIASLKKTLAKYDRVLGFARAAFLKKKSLGSRKEKVGRASYEWNELAHFLKIPLIFADYGKKFQDRLAEARKSSDKKGIKENERALLQLKLLTNKLETLRKVPKFTNFRRLREDYVEKTIALQDKAFAVAKAERILYDILYSSYKGTKPNSCADFKL